MAEEDVPGVESALEVIDAVDDSEQAALESVRRFLASVDHALPGGGDHDAPSRRLEVIDSGIKMIERLLGVSNDFARRITESIGELLPDVGNLLPGAKPAAVAEAPVRKAPAKKAVAKKAPARKAPVKKTAAKKAPAKKAPVKKTAAKKAPAKRPAKKKA